MLGSFAWKVIVCTKKVRDELLEMEKDKSVSPPPFHPLQSMGELFFVKKNGMGKQNFLENFMGDALHVD